MRPCSLILSSVQITKFWMLGIRGWINDFILGFGLVPPLNKSWLAIDFIWMLWYHLSKTLAEEAAWKFSGENGVELVTILPGMVVGPLLQPTLNTSCTYINNLINGSTTFLNSCLRWINVKDVAMAHILAFEVPSANGRYCLVERAAHLSEVVDIIRKLYPSIPVPEKCVDDKPFETIYQVSKKKARSLGLDFIPLEQSVEETIESLKEKGFVTF